MTTVNIGTASELVAFAARVNAGETTLDAKLTADIDLSGVTWTPIGTETYPYAGTFDGGGRTISNLNDGFITYSSSDGLLTKTFFDSCTVTSGNVFASISADKCCFTDIEVTIYGGVGKTAYVTKTATDCIFDSCIISSTSGNAYARLTNSASSCYVIDSSVSASSMIDPTNVIALSSGYSSAMDSVVISLSLSSQSYGGNAYGYSAISATWGPDSSVSNCYSSSSINSGKGGKFASNIYINRGTVVDSSVFNTESFWHGGSYLNWDFTDIWYWDSEENLPKLKVFRPTVLKIYNGSSWVDGTPYIYTSMGWVKNGDIVGGYNAVYCSDQTNYPFNDGNGNITVTDGTDYYWYNTTTGTTTLISASGVTWDVINTLGSDGYVQSDGVDDRIYTGYAPQNSYFKLEFSMTPVTLKSSGNYFYRGTEGSWLSFEYTSSSGAYWNAGSTTIFGSHSMGTGNTYTYSIVYQNGIFSSSGSYSYSRTYSGSITCTDFVFFSSTSGNYSSEKLYYLKMYSSSDTLVRDYIPIIYGSNYALYDRVENKIYNNAGTGSFSGGGTPTPLVVGERTVTLKKYIYTSNGWKEF